ncbi:MAG: marine proteobacterial sortase target protein, partial [Pseudomonadota bacterium]
MSPSIRPRLFIALLAARASGLALAVAAAAAVVGGAVATAQARAPAPITPAAAQAEGLVRLAEMDRGALLFFTDQPGYYVPAPLLATKMHVDVAGPIARARVTQRFKNPAEVFVEGKYIFPLPEGAAVDALKMRVADRWIEGDVKERQEAKRVYERAKAEGYVASLVEQERPNLFTTSVANIAPGATVVIQIEYQTRLEPRDGAFGLRLPLVVAPRYAPEPVVRAVKFGPNGWELDSDDPVPDRERITAPTADPRAEPDGAIRNPVEITVDLEAGFPLGPIKSLYHEVDVTPRGVDGAVVTLSGPAPADRDFYLSWTPTRLDAPYAALFVEDKADARHLVMMVTPPARAAAEAAEPPAREVIFVQDVSGSMSGQSIEQARAALEMAVRRLRPEDLFNIIVFNTEFAAFADAPLPATPANVARAVEAVRALEADGGTEMLPALDAALKDDAPEDARLRQVIFLTDGAVGDEAAMLALIKERLGRSRIFTVGIGSAPNSYFMTAAAQDGRGTHVFIGDLGEVRARMEALFAKIETPAMTDVDVAIDLAAGAQAAGASAEIWPNPLPDLYVGDPVVATAKLPRDAEAASVRLSGRRGEVVWEATLPIAEAEPRVGVSKLWARQRIASLESFRLSPEAIRDQAAWEAIDREILATALEHDLVSRLTSLVAVDVTPTRPPEASAVSREVPLNLPAGWDAAAFFDSPDAPAPDAAPQPTLLRKASLDRLQVA